MTDTPQIKVDRYFIHLTRQNGETIVVTDEDGGPFYSEATAQASLADVEARHPGLNAIVSQCIYVDLDEGGDVPNTALNHCPAQLPEAMLAALQRAGEVWRGSPFRPRVAPQVQARWERLIDDWTRDESLPIFVRKHRGNRGHFVTHHTGRVLVPADNTPAHWSMGLALDDECPDLDEIRCLFERDAIPIAMTMAATEKANANLTGAHAVWHGRLNYLGWKVCHSHELGLRTRTALQQVSIDLLLEHFRSFVDPANMFLVPLKWAGFGELPEVRKLFYRDK